MGMCRLCECAVGDSVCSDCLDEWWKNCSSTKQLQADNAEQAAELKRLESLLLQCKMYAMQTTGEKSHDAGAVSKMHSVVPNDIPAYINDTIADLECKVAEQMAELERLRAIVDKLPKTANGVTVLWGDPVWDNLYGVKMWHVVEVRPGNLILVTDGAGSKFWRSSRDFTARKRPQSCKTSD